MTGAQQTDQLRNQFDNRVTELVRIVSDPRWDTLTVDQAEACVLKAATELVDTLTNRVRANRRMAK